MLFRSTNGPALESGKAAEIDDQPSVSGSPSVSPQVSASGVRSRKRRHPTNEKAVATASHGIAGKNAAASAGPRKRKRRKADAEVNEADDQVCEQCDSGMHGDAMLLCDRCDKGWHLYCLSPPLESVPPGNWYCSDCRNSDSDCFGFVERRKTCLLDAFRRFDEKVRRRWFGQRRSSRVQVEKQFWEIVEGKAGELEVMYGRDRKSVV